MPDPGITVDTSSVAKAFFNGRWDFKEAVEGALKKVGKRIERDAKAFAPKRSGDLAKSLYVEVSNIGDSTFELRVAVEAINTTQRYWAQREFGGPIHGNPKLYFVPTFSPLYYAKPPLTARAIFGDPTVAGVERVFITPSGKLLMGVKRGGRGSSNKRGRDRLVPLMVIKDSVQQTGVEYIGRAIRAHQNEASEEVIKAIAKVLDANS